MKKMAVKGTQYPGIMHQIIRGAVVLTKIPTELSKLKKNEVQQQ